MYSLKSSTWLRLITHHKSKCIHIKSREIRLHSIWLCGKSHIQRQHSFFLFDRLQEIIESNINIITNTKMLSTSIFSLSIHLNAHLFVYRIVFGCSDCSRGRDYSNSFDFGALSVFCYYFWLNYTPLVALTRNQANINFFSFCIGRACGGWLAGWLACFVYALSWFILFLLVFFPLGWQQSEKWGPWFFVCIRLWFNYIWLYSVYELYITSHNCLLYALHKLLSFKQQLRCIAATFFSLLYLACSFVSLYIFPNIFVSFLITFGFGKFQ